MWKSHNNAGATPLLKMAGAGAGAGGTISGRADSIGKPLLYSVTDRFMDYFGIKSLEDLPQPKDFALPESTVGKPEELMVEEE